MVTEFTDLESAIRYGIEVAIKNGGSQNQVAKASGVPQSSISRFLAGSSLDVASMNLLIQTLGIDLTVTVPEEIDVREVERGDRRAEGAGAVP